LPAAFALGAALPAPSGVELGWRQVCRDRDPELWSLAAPAAEHGAQIERIEADVSAEDVAIVLSVSQNAEQAVKASRDDLPSFRGYVRVQGPDGAELDVASPGAAAALARQTMECVREVRRQWPGITRFHLFAAAPAGLLMLLGRLANGLGPVQTYEHEPIDAVGRYRAAALVHCGA
jgi:hypothetical protein